MTARLEMPTVLRVAVTDATFTFDTPTAADLIGSTTGDGPKHLAMLTHGGSDRHGRPPRRRAPGERGHGDRYRGRASF